MHMHLSEYIALFLYFFPFLGKFLEVEILIQKIFRKTVPIYILTTVYKNTQFSNKLLLSLQLLSFKIFASCQTKDGALIFTSLTTSQVKHLFLCLLSILLFSFVCCQSMFPLFFYWKTFSYCFVKTLSILNIT